MTSYFKTLVITDKFPTRPPKLICKAKVYHPNISSDGTINMPILKEKKSKLSTMNYTDSHDDTEETFCWKSSRSLFEGNFDIQAI